MKQLNLFVGSVAWTGLFPIAPATFTTAAVAGVLWLWAPGPMTLATLLLISLIVSVPVASRMEKDFGKDPSRCTVDELAGFLIVVQGRELSFPGSWKLLLTAFFLFRFFDIFKIWPGRKLEDWPAGWGIVADDLMAGIYSLITLLILLALFPWLN